MNIKQLIAAVAAAFVALGGQAAVAADQKFAPPKEIKLPPRVELPKLPPSKPITLDDLKPRYVPSMPRPDLARPLPPAPPLAPRPNVSMDIGPGKIGVAPTLNVPLRNGGQMEFKGPDLHPQLPPLNGGAVSVTVPMPEGKKK